MPAITVGSLLAGDTTIWTQTFSNPNAGTGKTLTPAGAVNDGNGGNNYAVTFVPNTTGVITQLTIAGSITVENKVYDGTAAATIATRMLTGVIGGDAVTLVGGTAAFSDKNVANGKTVTATGLSLSGSAAGNYKVNSTATTTANITPALLLITADNKHVGDDDPTPLSPRRTTFCWEEIRKSLAGTLYTDASPQQPAGSANHLLGADFEQLHDQSMSRGYSRCTATEGSCLDRLKLVHRALLLHLLSICPAQWQMLRPDR